MGASWEHAAWVWTVEVKNLFDSCIEEVFVGNFAKISVA